MAGFNIPLVGKEERSSVASRQAETNTSERELRSLSLPNIPETSINQDVFASLSLPRHTIDTFEARHARTVHIGATTISLEAKSNA